MRVLNLRLAAGLAVLVAVAAAVSSASAGVRNFVIDPTRSSLSFSADVDLDPNDPSSPIFSTQSQLNFIPSLPHVTDGTVTSYTGNLLAIVNNTSVTYVGGSMADASISGVWCPVEGGGPIVPGTDPTLGGTNLEHADYAFTLDAIVWSALRNFQVDALSGPLPRTGGTYNSAGVVLPVLSGSLSNTSILGDIGDVLGSLDLTGAPLGAPSFGGSNAGGVGTITPFGLSGMEITVPVDITQPLPLGSALAFLRVTGTLTAIDVPEPGSIALAGIGLLGLAALVARRRG